MKTRMEKYVFIILSLFQCLINVVPSVWFFLLSLLPPFFFPSPLPLCLSLLYFYLTFFFLCVLPCHLIVLLFLFYLHSFLLLDSLFFLDSVPHSLLPFLMLSNPSFLSSTFLNLSKLISFISFPSNIVLFSFHPLTCCSIFLPSSCLPCVLCPSQSFLPSFLLFLISLLSYDNMTLSVQTFFSITTKFWPISNLF